MAVYSILGYKAYALSGGFIVITVTAKVNNLFM